MTRTRPVIPRIKPRSISSARSSNCGAKLEKVDEDEVEVEVQEDWVVVAVGEVLLGTDDTSSEVRTQFGLDAVGVGGHLGNSVVDVEDVEVLVRVVRMIGSNNVMLVWIVHFQRVHGSRGLLSSSSHEYGFNGSTQFERLKTGQNVFFLKSTYF